MNITPATKQYSISFTRPTPNPAELEGLSMIARANDGQVIYSSLIAADTIHDALEWLTIHEPNGYDVVSAEAVFGFRGELPHNWVA